MTRSCKYCGRIHPLGERCAAAPRRKKKQTEASRVRSSYAWTKKAKQIKARDHHLCLYCLCQGVITAEELEVHHIVPVEQDESLAFEETNLITLCQRHHEEAEKGEIPAFELKRLAAAGARAIPPGVRGLVSGGFSRPRGP